jgi:hypothetical protein
MVRETTRYRTRGPLGGIWPWRLHGLTVAGEDHRRSGWQLAGQEATVEIDRYLGRGFSAEVTSVSPSTGSQFSLLPPENATGNWVKVVQRVPVRLQLTQVDAGFLLQAGLSADVTVDTQSHERKLAAATGPTSAAGTVLP